MQQTITQDTETEPGRWAGLSPLTGPGSERWLVQARLQIDGTGERGLTAMVLHCPGDAGWALMASITDPGSGRLTVISQANPGLVDGFGAKTVDVLVGGGMAPELARAYRDELLEYGPPEPVRVCHSEVLSAQDRLSIVWDRFALDQRAGGDLRLVLPVPESPEVMELSLRPVVPWVQDAAPGEFAGHGTAGYVYCARLDISGTFGKSEISGRAWFDRLWSTQSWFDPASKKAPLPAWARLGVNLDDGRDFLLVNVEDVMAGGTIRENATLLAPGSGPRTIPGTHGRARSRWSSPDTHAEYPVAWEIDLPEMAGALTFTPEMTGCEVPVYGSPGAIWAGAGRVAGEIGGQTVTGHGYLDLAGFAQPAAFERIKAGWIERIDRHIADVLPKRITDAWLADVAGPPRYRFDTEGFGQQISEPCWALMSRGGKHWRAVFAILMLRAFGVDVERYEALITTIPEMLHAGSLMIDDIQDHSELRRGGPTIHRLFGEEITINAANSLYFLPLQAVSRHPHLDLEQREAILRIAIDLFVTAHMGQAQDLNARNWHLDEVLADPGRYADIVLQTCTLKTGAPVRALAEMLCVIARCDAETTQDAMGFAEAAGIAYQIMDDVNTFTAGASWGKETGEDVREGQVTYVILRALAALPQDRGDLLAEFLTSGAKTPQQRREACGLVAASGVPATCRDEARRMINEPWSKLSAHMPPSHSKTLLRLMFARLFASSVEPQQN